MQTLKYFLLFSIIFGSLIFLFGPEVIPENFKPEEILTLAAGKDVIIIFNSGGWGNTPLEKAQDFSPVISGIQETLYKQGYNSIVIPFYRTKNTLMGKIAGAKDFFSSYSLSSEILAKNLEFLTKNLPNKRIILAGLSDGAAFINKTYEKASGEAKKSVYTIIAGTPFWSKTLKSDNVLQLDNNGEDSLTGGEVKSLFSVLFQAPFRWIASELNGQNLSFSRLFHISGHDYDWESPAVSSKIITFLKSKFKN